MWWSFNSSPGCQQNRKGISNTGDLWLGKTRRKHHYQPHKVSKECSMLLHSFTSARQPHRLICGACKCKQTAEDSERHSAKLVAIWQYTANMISSHWVDLWNQATISVDHCNDNRPLHKPAWCVPGSHCPTHLNIVWCHCGHKIDVVLHKKKEKKPPNLNHKSCNCAACLVHRYILPDAGTDILWTCA